MAYRWRSLPRVRRHNTSKPQGSPELVLPCQVTMDQLICASLFHAHFRYGVGVLKVPAVLYTKRKKQWRWLTKSVQDLCLVISSSRLSNNFSNSVSTNLAILACSTGKLFFSRPSLRVIMCFTREKLHCPHPR